MYTATGQVAAELYDRLPDAVFMVDTDNRIAYVSAACERMFGYTPAEMTGKALFDLVAPEDREKTRLEARAVMQGNAKVGFENRYLHKSGEAVHVMWSTRWLEAEGLRLGIARDITHLKRADAPAFEVAASVSALASHERKVLQLLLTDATEKQIAAQLGLAVSTTHSYITGIFRKFGVRGRAGLMSLWLVPAQDGLGG